MALFISRLMDKMDPMAEDEDTVFGYTPEDVVDVPDGDDDDEDPDKTVKSPFGDLGTSTKTAYDAITALWELEVASGVNETNYGPSQSITRASMAGFMAGVLNHSNARPAGVTIQASKPWDFGDIGIPDNPSTVAVSYRDESFMPMVDVSIKVFESGNDVDAGVGSFNEDGGCKTAAECAWTDDESLTDASGNIYVDGSVSNGKTNTYYAWMGDPEGDENDFDVDTSPHASVTLSSTTDAVNLKVTTDINSNSTGSNTVDIDATDEVTLTAQLVDDDGEPVAKSGVEVSLVVVQGGNTLHPGPASIKTDDDGKVTFTTGGPKSTKGNTDPDRVDVIRFMSNVDGDAQGVEDTATDTVDGSVAVGDNDENVAATIVWTDSNPTLVSAVATEDAQNNTISRAAVGMGKGSTDPYAVLSGQGKVTIRASVTFYDQYGNTTGKGSKVAIDIGAADVVIRTVSSRGVASWTATLDLADESNQGLNSSQTVTYALQESTATPDSLAPLTGAPTVESTTVVAVRHADDDSSADATLITAVYGDEDRFRINGALYTYDADDLFVSDAGTDVDGEVVDMAKFEMLIGANLDTPPTTQANIEIVSYDDDGSSIFRVGTAATP